MPALTIPAAQRATLRAQAHALKPVVLIGADGLTDAVLAEIELALVSHHLIKIRVFGDDREARVAAYESICERTGAAPIQHIGKLLVVWRLVKPEPDSGRSAPRSRLGSLPLPRKSTGSSTRPPAPGAARGASRPSAAGAGRNGARAPAGSGARSASAVARVPAADGTRASAGSAARTPLRSSSQRPSRGAPKAPQGGAARTPSKSGGSRIVKVTKPTGNPSRKPKPKNVLVRGNERVTAGGLVKRGKKRPTSIKRSAQQGK